jgi:hypothetical protein
MSGSSPIPELAVVALTQDLPEYNLRAGDFGTVVFAPDQGEGYLVEFCSSAGETIAVTAVSSSQVRPVEDGEIAQRRTE